MDIKKLLLDDADIRNLLVEEKEMEDKVEKEKEKEVKKDDKEKEKEVKKGGSEDIKDRMAKMRAMRKFAKKDDKEDTKEKDKEIKDEGTDKEKELKVGEKIEHEHEGTFDWVIDSIKGKDTKENAGAMSAIKDEFYKRIAQDHINEFPNYYTNLDCGLVVMEKKLKKGKKSDEEV